MRCQDDINTEHNIKSIYRAAVAQWTKRLTRNKQTRVQIREAHIFDITKFSNNFEILVKSCSILFIFFLKCVFNLTKLKTLSKILIF